MPCRHTRRGHTSNAVVEAAHANAWASKAAVENARDQHPSGPTRTAQGRCASAHKVFVVAQISPHPNAAPNPYTAVNAEVGVRTKDVIRNTRRV